MFKMMSGMFGALSVTPPVFRLVVYAHIFGAGYYVWDKTKEVYFHIKPVVLGHLDQVLNMLGSLS